VSFDLELQNRRALVTGGTKGIGAAVVSVLQGGDRLDERVMVRTGRLQVRLHMIVGRAKKGVADARVIDEQLAQVWVRKVLLAISPMISWKRMFSRLIASPLRPFIAARKRSWHCRSSASWAGLTCSTARRPTAS
jgi:NAD(P)-dependent dehydrogenase (short-subunit alcohol dehydrogenase family)